MPFNKVLVYGIETQEEVILVNQRVNCEAYEILEYQTIGEMIGKEVQCEFRCYYGTEVPIGRLIILKVDATLLEIWTKEHKTTIFPIDKTRLKETQKEHYYEII